MLFALQLRGINTLIMSVRKGGYALTVQPVENIFEVFSPDCASTASNWVLAKYRMEATCKYQCTLVWETRNSVANIIMLNIKFHICIKAMLARCLLFFTTRSQIKLRIYIYWIYKCNSIYFFVRQVCVCMQVCVLNNRRGNGAWPESI